MGFQLVISEGKEAGREFLFDQTSVVIGRTPGCDVILYDAGISRRHARIFDEGVGILIEDLGSSNGITVNGSKVAKQTLKDGDSIVLGPVKFTFTAVVGDVPAEEPTTVGESDGQHTRVVKASELKRSRNKGVALLPQNVNTGEREKLERNSTQMMAALSRPSPSAPHPRVSRPHGPSPLIRPDPAALEEPESNTDPDQAQSLEPTNRKRLTAAERARLRRSGLGGAMKVFWLEASWLKRFATVAFGSVFASLVIAVFFQAMVPEEIKKAAEALELSEEPTDQSYGVGKTVTWERTDQKAFEFEVKSPVDVVVVLHYQCGDLSENELSVSVNGVDMGFAPADTMAVAERDVELIIPSKHIERNSVNTVVFDNIKNPPENDPWRIWNLWVEVTVLPEKDVVGLKADASEKFERGTQKWEQRDIGSANRWEAYKAFREAWLTFEAVAPEDRGPLYQLSREAMMKARRELDNQCNKLLMQARGEFKMGKVEDASKTLDWVEKFFPTKAHPCQYRASAERAELGATLLE
jgi:pSer/pThr/pTyr-binding forkhead associated (FHA) protein